MLEGEVARPQRQGADDLGVRLERHVQHPVQRQDGKHQVQDQERGAPPGGVVMHCHAPRRRRPWCPRAASSCRG
ncbi:hypothetical protein G6F58_013559 [Rhizopus delemar]|nr:hypothetical protein G6F58_013559 [Rhizopus delemar]